MAAGTGTYVHNLNDVRWGDPAWDPPNHPTRVAVTPNTIYDYDTGQMIASVTPGYRFFWAHRHIHVAPVTWTNGQLDEHEHA